MKTEYQYNAQWKIEQNIGDHSIIFKVFELVNYDPDDLEESMEFSVNVGGCANVEYNKNDVLTHFCEPGHLTEFYELQMFMYKRAEQLIGGF